MSEETGMVNLISSEGERFPTPIPVASLSELVKTTIDDDDDDGETQDVPIPNVKAATLTKVLEFCTHYQTEEMTPIQTPLKSSKIDDLVQPWYAAYVQVDQSLLFELVTAANFMDIKPLLDLTCLAVSVFIKGKSAEELRRMFNIADQLSPEEEAQVREENRWAQQPES
jgi:S-phase kinase-associated protein 1